MHGSASLLGRSVYAISCLVGCVAPDDTELQQSGSEVVDCARLVENGLERQENLRASLLRITCGLETPGSAQAEATAFATAGPGANVDTITGGESFAHVTQSESMVWSSDGMTIVVNYNDSQAAPTNFSGVSVSTNGGSTFTRLLPSPFATGHGTNFGDPILVYNARLARWFAGDLATGCGGQGIGLWTSLDGVSWSVGACAHSGTSDDRQSMWVDNEPASPFFGRMYVSWNDFAVGGGALFVTHSDNGTTWTPLSLTAGFVRNVQLTGGLDGTVFVAAMNEGGGGFNPRTNQMFRSTDGGASWSLFSMGAAFAPPGDGLCASNTYFAMMTPIWRHMGWGQPGVGPGGVVHYAYAGRGINAGDTGDIYYVRSTDNGATWSTPLVLNTDRVTGGTRSQWMPSLSVTDSGDVAVYWYDRRSTTDGQNYEVWSASSSDNGATFQADVRVSDTLIPQPEQPDPNIQSCYAGDYNNASAFGTTHFATWTDGRVPVAGHFTQDVFSAPITAGPSQPDFTIATSPAALSIAQGGNGTSTTTIGSTAGFSSAVALACTGQPAGVTCAFTPNPVTPPANGTATSALAVAVAASVPTGTYQLAVTGTSGALAHATPLSVTVTPAGGATITVIAPNGGETLRINRKTRLDWSSSGITGNVNIDVSRDGGVTFQALFSNTANDGNQTWRVTGPATSQARLRVCNVAGTVCDVSDGNFVIQ